LASFTLFCVLTGGGYNKFILGIEPETNADVIQRHSSEFSEDENAASESLESATFSLSGTGQLREGANAPPSR
jgi:hypothetical protein